MRTGPTSDYYISRKTPLLWLFDWSAHTIRRVAVRHYGADTIGTMTREARREFESLIPHLPYLGGDASQHTWLIIGAGLFLSLYKTLRRQGRPVEEIGALVAEAVVAFYRSYPRFLLRLYGRLSISRFAMQRAHKLARESQERPYAEGWIFSFVEGDGKAFDWGWDYTACGICKFFHAQDADEFIPYMCQLDFLASDYFGWGLMRTMTIAQGDERCDFRFKTKRTKVITGA
jgi:hypothetical protein